MTPLLPIPSSWAWTTLGEIADVVGGVTKDSKKQADPAFRRVPYLRVANVQRGYLDLREITKIRVPESTVAKLRLQPGDVLLNEGGDRDKLGRGWVWDGQIPDCIHQNHVFRARLAEGSLHPKLLAWYANETARSWFEQNASQSVNLASISLSTIKRLPLPLPPREEQERIIAALEDHLSRLDVAEALIGRVEMRSRLLASRVRDTHAERLKYTVRPLLSLLSEPLANGRSVPTDKQGFPVLRLTAIQNGRLELAERKGGRWSEAEATPFKVQEGDFFVSRGNGSLRLVGRGALLEEEPDPVAFPDTMIRIRLDRRQMLPYFLRLMWDSRQVRSQIEGAARTTAGIYKINQKIIESILVPAPDVAEQEQVASELEQTLAAAARAISFARQVQLRAVRLRRSLMAEAFAGRLVSRDSHDEPATVLLERIRAERSAQPRARRIRVLGPRQETLL